jgi:hypothetical protein
MGDIIEKLKGLVEVLGKLHELILLASIGGILLLLGGLEKIGSYSINMSQWLRIVFTIVGCLLLAFVCFAYWRVSAGQRGVRATGGDHQRKILTGFHEIFAEAYRLISNAEREILVVNFVLHFGAPHLNNRQIVEDYYGMTDKRRTLQDDVKTLLAIFQDKVKTTPKIRILTITDVDARDNFIDHLCRKPGYKTLDAVAELDDIKTQKTAFELWTKDRPSRLPPGVDSRCELFEANRLPIQLLIVGLKPDDGDLRAKSACLAFMVGTETLETDSTDERLTGFYTEMPSETAIFKNMVTALIRQDRIQKRVECR